MNRRVRKTALQVLIFIAALVLISALGIWLDLGPVVRSEFGNWVNYQITQLPN